MSRSNHIGAVAEKNIELQTLFCVIYGGMTQTSLYNMNLVVQHF